MKRSTVTILLLAVLAARVGFLQDARSGGLIAANAPEGQGQIFPLTISAGSPSKPAPPARIVVRGWEITDASAIERPSLARIIPEYQDKQPAGNRATTLSPRHGKFLVVQVSCAWGTMDPLREPLWSGRPDVKLVDTANNEYPVFSILTRESGKYLAKGMRSARAARPRGSYTDKAVRILLSFDLPVSADPVCLQFSNGGPRVPINKGPDLPGPSDDIVAQ